MQAGFLIFVFTLKTRYSVRKGSGTTNYYWCYLLKIERRETRAYYG